MKFDITDVIERYPDVHIGVLTAIEINNKVVVDGLKTLQREAIQEAERQIGDQPPTKHPHIASWRELYRSFGTKPGDYRPSAEALIRRAIKTGELPTINAAVDIYNLVSVKHIIPMGGFDTDHVQGQIIHRSGVLPVDSVAAVTGQIDVVTKDDRAGCASAGEVLFPDHVLGICPRRGQGLIGRDALASGASELGPVSGPGDVAGQDGCRDGKAGVSHGCSFHDDTAVQNGRFSIY